MTATIEKSKDQLLAEFNEWYDQREREEKLCGKKITWEEIESKVLELDIEEEFVDQEVHAAREEIRLEGQRATETDGK